MSNTNFDELLNAGCHFGHLTVNGILKWLRIFLWSVMISTLLT